MSIVFGTYNYGGVVRTVVPLVKKEMDELGGLLDGLVVIVTMEGYGTFHALIPRHEDHCLYVHPTLFERLDNESFVRVAWSGEDELFCTHLGPNYGPSQRNNHRYKSGLVELSPAPVDLVSRFQTMFRMEGSRLCASGSRCLGADGRPLEPIRTALVRVDGELKLMCRGCCILARERKNPPEFVFLGWTLLPGVLDIVMDLPQCRMLPQQK